MLTRQQRTKMAEEIVEQMRAHYQEHGEDGDFPDGLRYLRDEATDEELEYEHRRWVKTG